MDKFIYRRISVLSPSQKKTRTENKNEKIIEIVETIRKAKTVPKARGTENLNERKVLLKRLHVRIDSGFG